MTVVDMSDKQACQLHPNANFLGEADFIGTDGELREYTLTVAKVTEEDLQLPGTSKKEKKVVLAFTEAKKRLVLNKTNSTAIKSHYGKKVADWYGKPVVAYFDPTVRFGNKVTGGVRIRRQA